jgi:hypothetical protein
MTMAQTASRKDMFKIIKSICRDGILAVRLGKARFTSLMLAKNVMLTSPFGEGSGVRLR